MVRFTNIRVDGDWLCADAEDLHNNISATIKVHRFLDKYESNVDSIDIIQAAWGLLNAFNKNKVKGSTHVIAWT